MAEQERQDRQDCGRQDRQDCGQQDRQDRGQQDRQDRGQQDGQDRGQQDRGQQDVQDQGQRDRQDIGQDNRAERRKHRRSYLRDFVRDQDGSYVYTGKTWHADPALRRRMLLKLWALQAAMLLAVLLPGFVTTAGLQNTFYVIIPYVFWLMSDLSLAYTLGSMTFGGNPLRDYVYQRSVPRYPFLTALALAGAALTALGLLVFLLRDGGGEGAAVCFICCAVQIAASVMAGRCKVDDLWQRNP